jgi:hypothetical protein
VEAVTSVNTNEKDKYKRYLNILSKVVPMNDDESFKLGIVLSLSFSFVL